MSNDLFKKSHADISQPHDQDGDTQCRKFPASKRRKADWRENYWPIFVLNFFGKFSVFTMAVIKCFALILYKPQYIVWWWIWFDFEFILFVLPSRQWDDVGFLEEIVDTNNCRHPAYTTSQWWWVRSFVWPLRLLPQSRQPPALHPHPPYKLVFSPRSGMQLKHAVESCGWPLAVYNIVACWSYYVMTYNVRPPQSHLKTCAPNPNYQYCATVIVSANCFVLAWLEICRHANARFWYVRTRQLLCAFFGTMNLDVGEWWCRS